MFLPVVRFVLFFVLSLPSFIFANEVELVNAINLAAKKHQIDPALITAVIKVESNFKPTAISVKGARGLMQLMPVTQKEVGVNNPYSVVDNVMGGTAYLKKQLVRFKQIEKALWAYNAGPTNVIRNNKPKETHRYIKKVMSFYRAIKKAQLSM